MGPSTRPMEKHCAIEAFSSEIPTRPPSSDRLPPITAPLAWQRSSVPSKRPTKPPPSQISPHCTLPVAKLREMAPWLFPAKPPASHPALWHPTLPLAKLSRIVPLLSPTKPPVSKPPDTLAALQDSATVYGIIIPARPPHLMTKDPQRIRPVTATFVIRGSGAVLKASPTNPPTIALLPVA